MGAEFRHCGRGINGFHGCHLARRRHGQGTVTVTPSDGGGGGTFTPTTVGLTTAAPSATFTYTAGSAGVKTIGVTNDGGLTNPGSLSYTASAPACR